MTRGSAGAARGPVVCVSTSLATRGGISTYVRMLRGTELWSRWRVEHVATHRDGSAVDKVRQFGAALVRLVGLLRGRPALLHVHMSARGSFVRKALVLWLARARRVPVLVHVHGSEFDTFAAGLLRPLRPVVRLTLEHAALVVALGRTWADRLQAIAPRARVVVVPNAVRVPPTPADPGAGPVRVVFLGEIGDRKGAFTLLEAWAKLAAEPEVLDGAELTLAGDRGVERAERVIAERGIGGSAAVRSWLGPDEVAGLLAGSSVFVLPSRSEGQPMALLEAMAHGLCVVAGAVGGIPEMVQDGRDGLLVPPDDVDALAAALRRVLTDPALRVGLGSAARERVRAEFDLDVVWRRIDELYGEVAR